MADKLISAEEARGLLVGATPGPWRAEFTDARGAEVWTPDTHPNSAQRLGRTVGSGGYVRGEVSVVVNTHPSCDPRSDVLLDAKLIAAAPALARTVIALSEERDAYRDFAHRVAGIMAPPDAVDLAVKHLEFHGLDDLAETVADTLANLRTGLAETREVATREATVCARVCADKVILTGERDEARAERDRLRLILAAERGESAPEGWDFDHEELEWVCRVGALSEDVEPMDLYARFRRRWPAEACEYEDVVASVESEPWAWSVVEQIGMGDPGDTIACGTAPTAYEAMERAMEAADRAAKENTNE